MSDTPAPLHVYDWLALPPVDENERLAKEWLDRFTRPAYDKLTLGINEWLSKRKLTVEWRGQRYVCTGASRLGDVWLRGEGSICYYDHRVAVNELSNWAREDAPGTVEAPPAGVAPEPEINDDEE